MDNPKVPAAQPIVTPQSPFPLRRCATFPARFQRATAIPHFVTFNRDSWQKGAKSSQTIDLNSCNPAIHHPAFWAQFSALFAKAHAERKKKLKKSLEEKLVAQQILRTEKEDRINKMPSSCHDIRAALAACLQESDCIMIERNKPSDCLRAPLLETLPTKCQQLKKGYGECKRGMVDMRKRFRGNQPIAVSKELEGESSGQLYGGKSAFASTAKATDGNEPEERDWRELENEKYNKS